MANFGFTRLSVVAPYEEHWREAKSAVKAEDLLHSACKTQTLSEAIAGCTLVLGTASLRRRQPEQPVVPLPALAPIISQELARGGHVALVFGSEKRGLTGDNLSQCHQLVEIPTDPRQPSMNLGQAVAVCLYEIVTRTGGESPDPLPLHPDPPSTARDLDLLATVVEETMLAANYSPTAMRKANRHDVQLLLRRLALTGRDSRRILGLFRRILRRLRHPADQRDSQAPVVPHK
jgi:TrmH family RNA methyltransferase